MFVFLLAGVDFLLLFLLTSLKIAVSVDVGVLEEELLEVFAGEGATLADQSA